MVLRVNSSQLLRAVVLVTALGALIVGMGCTSYKMLSGDRKFPLHTEKFEIQPGGPYSEHENLDFSAVYYRREQSSPAGMGWYDLVRFWSNGRVMFQACLDHVPDRSDADRMTNSTYSGTTLGYFQVDGTNVVIEWFGAQGHAIYFPNVGFTREWAVIEGDDLTIYEGKTRELFSRRYRVDEHYKRLHLDGLTSQPDW